MYMVPLRILEGCFLRNLASGAVESVVHLALLRGHRNLLHPHRLLWEREQRPRARTALARYLHVLSAGEDESAEEKVDPLEALCVTAGEEAVPHLVIVERADAQKAHDGVDVPDAVEYRRPGEAPARLRFEGTHGCEFLYAAIADHMRLVEDEASPLHPECPDRTRTVIPSVSLTSVSYVVRTTRAGAVGPSRREVP